MFLVDSSDVGDANLASLSSGSSSSSNTRIYDDADGRLGECAAVLAAVLKDGGTAGVPLLVLANKQDREDSVEVVRIKEGFVRRVVEGESSGVNGEEGEGRQAYVRDSRVLPASALSGQGVRESIEWVATRVGWNKEARAPVMR